MRLYCIDGTNVVRMLWGYAPGFGAQESSDCAVLVEAFGALCRVLAGRLEVEVYFDGKGRPFGPAAATPANLRVRFSWEEPADDLILDRVRARAFAGDGGVTVVTGDGDLGRRAREEGGRWLQVRADGGLERVLRGIERRFLKQSHEE